MFLLISYEFPRISFGFPVISYDFLGLLITINRFVGCLFGLQVWCGLRFWSSAEPSNTGLVYGFGRFGL